MELIDRSKLIEKTIVLFTGNALTFWITLYQTFANLH